MVRAQADAWLRDRMARSRYRLLAEPELRASKRSDTLFVFGSGYSLTTIPPATWDHFAAHDTMGFNWFPHQDYVRMDYHVIREIAPNDLQPALWKPALAEYAQLIAGNRRYVDTIFLVQAGWRAVNGNRLLGHHLLPSGARVFRFFNRSRGVIEPPAQSFADGLVHAVGTINDSVNAGYLIGWKTIVLVGVDLYDNRYFWLGAEEQRATLDVVHPGLTLHDPFPAARRLIDVFRLWREWLAAQGVSLFIFNPRSLLAEVLPVYQQGGER